MMTIAMIAREPSTNARWTQTCVTDLRARVLEGQSVADIAAALNRTPADISDMMGRLRLHEHGRDGRTR